MIKRILKYNITEEEAQKTIADFLKDKNCSSKFLIELKKHPDYVCVNDVGGYVNRVLQKGDILTIYVDEEKSSAKIPPVFHPVKIIYEDEDLLVVDKPAGMPIHPSLNNYENSLANALAYYFKDQDTNFVFRCINRLDRDTSGLTIVAKHKLSGAILSRMVAAKSDPSAALPPIKREYLAIVKGELHPASGTISAPIAREDSSIITRCVDFENGENAVTHYNTIKYENGHSLISLVLETGRTHQIRVHLKHIGHPIIGDFLYNPDMSHINRQALHSYRLEFTHPITGEAMEFLAPLHGDMASIISPVSSESSQE